MRAEYNEYIVNRCNLFTLTFLVACLPLFASVFSSCSLEKEIDKDPHVSLYSLDPQKYVVPVIVTEQSSKGTPIDNASDMEDFGFFSSYTNTTQWSASTSSCNKMYNEKMVRDYLTNPSNPSLVLWQYDGTPVPWSAATAASMYSFFAYAPYATGTGSGGNGLTVTSTSSNVGIPTISYDVPALVEDQPDLMFADPVYDLLPTGHPVPLQMRHALTAVGFRVAGISERITSLSVTGVYVSGNAVMNGNGGAISWNLTGSKTAMNYSASIDFDSGQSYYSVTTSFTNPLMNDGWLMMLPQALSSDAKVKIGLSDGTTREVSLMTAPGDQWEAGKREIYNIFVTPAGATVVSPDQVELPYPAHTPSVETLSVVCIDFDGNPDLSQTWTLTVPSTAPWLTLSLASDGTGQVSTLSSAGPQTVYLYATSNLGPTAVPRSADLSLDNGATVAVTVTQKIYPDTKWVYVVEGATGSGSAWNDAVGSITSGIATAATLRSAGYTVHGILVAGGVDRLYNETVTITTDKVYGGWEGLWGTELPDNPIAPYTSGFRDLAKFKSIGSGTVSVSGANACLDGFILQGGSNVSFGVSSSAYVNAIEIRNNTTVGNILNVQGAGVVASNVLVFNNTGNVTVGSGAVLLNATVVENTGGLVCSAASLFNSVEWGNSVAFSSISPVSIQYCAFAAGSTYPSTPNNVELHANNTEWFSTTNVVPGPHFNLSTQTGNPYCSALSDRAPMLGRGDQTLFDTHASFFPVGYQTDIMGNPRNYLGIDAGCYEDGVWVGFKLRWASDRVYISSKQGAINEIPLLLPENETTQIGVQWSVSVNAVTQAVWTLLSTPPLSGSGTGVMVGVVNISTNADYTTGSERKVGELFFHTNLGAYLPDQLVEVWQVPGTTAVWESGYVGSFHKNDETSERYITGVNAYATANGPTNIAYYTHWTARIVVGLDWIKIDKNPKGYNGGEVIETFGGVVSGETPAGGDRAIRFRVGMKSTLPPGAPPRYGLIVLSRGNSAGSAAGAAWFFVRQGEQDDYLFRPADPRTNQPTDRATYARKFSPYYLRDPLERTGDMGYDLGQHGAVFTTHPTKLGYFFQRSRTVAYLRRDPAGLINNVGIQTNNTLPSAGESLYDPSREICPPGYRHPDMGELALSLYRNVAWTGGLTISATDAETLRNFAWGCYADGYYDQIAPDPVTATTEFLGTPPNVANRGMLMVNPYDYTSLFFAQTGTMIRGYENQPHSYFLTSSTYSNAQYYAGQAISGGFPSLGVSVYTPTVMIPTSASTSDANTHWVTGHIGVSCTKIAAATATQIRCILEPPY